MRKNKNQLPFLKIHLKFKEKNAKKTFVLCYGANYVTFATAKVYNKPNDIIKPLFVSIEINN